jgi:hypothetical protein
MTINATLFITPLIEFVTGKIIESGTSGDATKQAARATELVAINAALLQIDQGNPAGTVALAAALNTSALSPGEGLALQSLFAIIGNQLALVNSVAGGTLLGTAATAIATSILNAATTTAQAYIAKATAAPAAVSA